MGLLIESVKATFSVLKKCPQVLVFTIIYFTFGQLLPVVYGLGIPLLIFICLLYIFITLLYAATLQLVVKNALSSRRVSLLECVFSGLKKLHKVLGLMILLGLISVGFAIPIILITVFAFVLNIWSLLLISLIGIAVVIAGIYVFIRLRFSMSILMIENSGIIDSLRRSWKASKNKFWSIVGAFVLLSLLLIPCMIAVVIVGIISAMHQFGGLAYPTTTLSLVNFIILIALGVVPSALISFLPAAYYLKTKRGKEEG